MSRSKRITLVVAVLTLLPAVAQAQIGGLKKKAARAVATAAGVQSNAPATTSTTQDAPGTGPYNAYVLEMTAPVLERFETALAAESAERLEVAKVLATFPKPDEHAACQQRVMAGPEMQKLLDEYMAAMEKANGDSQKVMEASRMMDEGMKAIVASECGELPTAEREEELQKRPVAKGAEAGDFTTYQYAVLKERVVPFCRIGDAIERTDDGAVIPVDGRNRLVYSNAEIEALTPRCASLMQALADS